MKNIVTESNNREVAEKLIHETLDKAYGEQLARMQGITARELRKLQSQIDALECRMALQKEVWEQLSSLRHLHDTID